MARQQVVSFTVTCDVCGEVISESDTEGALQKISWEGVEYVVDLCPRDQAALGAVRDQLKVFVDAGQERETIGRRRATAGRSRTKGNAGGAGFRPANPQSGSNPHRSDMPTIRAWALGNGYQVGHRGRIPGTVLAAYQQAQSGATPSRQPGKAAKASV